MKQNVWCHIHAHFTFFFFLLSLVPLLNRDTQICVISLEERRMDFQGPGIEIRITEDLNEQEFFRCSSKCRKTIQFVMGGHSMLPTSSCKKSN